jgi:osmotically-inducible protein OsmY
MNDATELPQRIRAALEFERRVNLHRSALRVTSEAGMLVLAGEVPNVAAKRIAMRIARELAGHECEVVDALDVAPARRVADGDMLDTLTRSLLALGELRPCALRRRHRSELETPRVAASDTVCGQIEFAVSNGVVELSGSVASLSHRRVAEALAWWTPGCRNVIDRLRVEPPENDSDDELVDAIRFGWCSRSTRRRPRPSCLASA